MKKCDYEMVASRGTYKGTDVCVLSGCPCLVSDPNERHACKRLAFMRKYEERKQTERQEELRNIVERTEPREPPCQTNLL